jgi:diaminohydroxyphosphoribosylaminopyrimidine deaminase/5-amino-6-(5-phosphoribosylamino)uracil reductase
VTQQAQKSDKAYMHQALRLGCFGLGNTAPNPAVGCVLVSADGAVIGSGYTGKGGRPHAEAVALAEAGEQAKGATAYVTLEPCAHEGKTPPCANALIEAGIKRVVYAIDDPDPRVNGGGAAMLRDAGIEVASGVLADEARQDQLGFLLTKTDKRPMVTLKLAISANGFMRTPPDEDKWITGKLARHMGHLLRAQHDAIITGSGTLREDDPSLDCRLPGLADASPMPVVMGKSDLPAESKLALRAKGETLVHYQSETPSAVLQDLAARGMTRAMLECGPTLAAAFLKDDLVDELAIFVAPHEVYVDAELYGRVTEMKVFAPPHEMNFPEKSDMAQMELAFGRFMLSEEKRFADDAYYHYRRKKGTA